MHLPIRLVILVGIAAALIFPSSACAKDLPLDRIKLPPGFEISIFAADVPGARSMTLGKSGTLFVGTREQGKVYAVSDRNGDNKADEVITIAQGLTMPNGVAFREGALYVAEISRVLRFDDIENRLQHPPEPVVINSSFPGDRAHGWKFIAFGPDGKLYVPVGMPCNICVREESIYGTITRMNPDGSDLETFASGIRQRGLPLFLRLRLSGFGELLGHDFSIKELYGDDAVAVFPCGGASGKSSEVDAGGFGWRPQNFFDLLTGHTRLYFLKVVLINLRAATKGFTRQHE